MQPLPVKMPLPCDFSLVAYYPMLIFLVIVIGLATVIMILAHIFNPRRITPVKQMPYESGMDPIGDARGKFDVRCYLVAILFLVFDVELLFLYPWAVATQGDRCSRGADSAAIWSEVACSIAGYLASNWVWPSSLRKACRSFTLGATLICASAAALLPPWIRLATLGAQRLGRDIGVVPGGCLIGHDFGT